MEYLIGFSIASASHLRFAMQHNQAYRTLNTFGHIGCRAFFFDLIKHEERRDRRLSLFLFEYMRTVEQALI